MRRAALIEADKPRRWRFCPSGLLCTNWQAYPPYCPCGLESSDASLMRRSRVEDQLSSRWGLLHALEYIFVNCAACSLSVADSMMSRPMRSPAAAISVRGTAVDVVAINSKGV